MKFLRIEGDFFKFFKECCLKIYFCPPIFMTQIFALPPIFMISLHRWSPSSHMSVPSVVQCSFHTIKSISRLCHNHLSLRSCKCAKGRFFPTLGRTEPL